MRKSECEMLAENWLTAMDDRPPTEQALPAPPVAGRKRDDHIVECHTDALALVPKELSRPEYIL